MQKPGRVRGMEEEKEREGGLFGSNLPLNLILLIFCKMKKSQLHLEENNQAILNRLLAYDSDVVLDLSGIHLGSITEDLRQKIESKFPNLLELKLNLCSLENLENFPRIPSIARVELDENNLTVESLTELKCLISSLVSISLYKNPVDKLKLIPSSKNSKN